MFKHIIVFIVFLCSKSPISHISFISFFACFGTHILNDKHLPLHSDLLRSISHIFDTYRAIIWKWPMISYRWPSLTIENDGLWNNPLTTKHYFTTNLLISIFPCITTFYRQTWPFIAALALGFFCVYIQKNTVWMMNVVVNNHKQN